MYDSGATPAHKACGLFLDVVPLFEIEERVDFGIITLHRRLSKTEINPASLGRAPASMV